MIVGSHHQDTPIDAARSLQESGLPEDILNYLLAHSVAVNRLDTPFEERELVRVLVSTQWNIRQIIYAYEAPGFTRALSYVTHPSEQDTPKHTEKNLLNPGVYGVVRHSRDTISLVMFLRQPFITRAGIDRENVQLLAIFSQYRKLIEDIQKKNDSHQPVLTLVGILPGLAIKRRQYLVGFEPEVAMCEATNNKSAGFVALALRGFLTRENLAEEDLIILGHRGTLGEKVFESFPGASGVEKNDTVPVSPGRSRVFLDATAGGSLGPYSKKLIPDDFWINEAYPPPDLEISNAAHEKGVRVCHIAGVAGSIFPALPSGYSGNIIPCCMGLPEQDDATVKIVEWPPKGG